MAKDRARPFSRKHRKYWLTVTGGMLLIGGLNVGIGMCAYDGTPDHVQRIEPVLPAATVIPAPPRPPGEIGLGEIPAPVMRAFTKAHPQHVPLSAKKIDDEVNPPTFDIRFVEGAVTKTVTFRADGTPMATAP